MNTQENQPKPDLPVTDDKLKVSIIINIKCIFKWLWIPLLVFTLSFLAWAIFINKGYVNDSWNIWRQCLMMAVLILIVIAINLCDDDPEFSILAALSTLVPWCFAILIIAVAALSELNLSFLTFEWFYIPLLATLVFPSLVGLMAMLRPY